MAQQVAGKSTRGPGHTGSIPKKKKEQSGRKRGEKSVRKVRPAKEKVAPKSPRVKGQTEEGFGGSGKTRVGSRGGASTGAMGARKKREQRKPSQIH